MSEICSAAEIQPSVFYKWERDLLEAAPSLFTSRRAPNREQELEAKVAALEAKLVRKDAIIAEVSEEYVKLKSVLPASMRESGGGSSYGHEQEDGSWHDREGMRRYVDGAGFWAAVERWVIRRQGWRVVPTPCTLLHEVTHLQLSYRDEPAAYGNEFACFGCGTGKPPER